MEIEFIYDEGLENIIGHTVLNIILFVFIRQYAHTSMSTSVTC